MNCKNILQFLLYFRSNKYSLGEQKGLLYIQPLVKNSYFEVKYYETKKTSIKTLNQLFYCKLIIFTAYSVSMNIKRPLILQHYPLSGDILFTHNRPITACVTLITVLLPWKTWPSHRALLRWNLYQTSAHLTFCATSVSAFIKTAFRVII